MLSPNTADKGVSFYMISIVINKAGDFDGAWEEHLSR